MTPESSSAGPLTTDAAAERARGRAQESGHAVSVVVARLELVAVIG